MIFINNLQTNENRELIFNIYTNSSMQTSMVIIRLSDVTYLALYVTLKGVKGPNFWPKNIKYL